jgi:hypothetical protein
MASKLAPRIRFAFPSPQVQAQQRTRFVPSAHDPLYFHPAQAAPSTAAEPRVSFEPQAAVPVQDARRCKELNAHDPLYLFRVGDQPTVSIPPMPAPSPAATSPLQHLSPHLQRALQLDIAPPIGAAATGSRRPTPRPSAAQASWAKCLTQAVRHATSPHCSPMANAQTLAESSFRARATSADAVESPAIFLPGPLRLTRLGSA